MKKTLLKFVIIRSIFDRIKSFYEPIFVFNKVILASILGLFLNKEELCTLKIRPQYLVRHQITRVLYCPTEFNHNDVTTIISLYRATAKPKTRQQWH